jgi:hypothetical protein
MRWLTNGLLAMAAVYSLSTGAAHAQGVRQHEGFHLHLDLGGGGIRSEASEGGNDAEFSGGAATFSVAVGYNVAPNFVVAGSLWSLAATDPDFELNGVKTSTNDVTLGVTGIGVNLTYYFMPINIYLSATPSITVASLEVGNTKFETDAGFGIRLAAGKEWWVSDNWALGLNLQYAYSSNEEDEAVDPATWKTNFFGVAFSATYD